MKEINTVAHIVYIILFILFPKQDVKMHRYGSPININPSGVAMIAQEWKEGIFAYMRMNCIE